MNPLKMNNNHRGNRLAIYALSASLLAVAASNWSRAPQVNAQAPSPSAIRPMSPHSKAALTAVEDAFVELADRVAPSVVTISAKGANTTRSVPPGAAPSSTGSGVIVREEGNAYYVLTNNHVVANRTEITVQTADQAEYPAELIGRDELTDLAVLRFKARQPLPAGAVATFGDSSQVRVGQWAIAIGSPLGYRSTFTVGVISATGRQIIGAPTSSAGDLIQTDASINPGNSGGPLLNINGEVVGINVAIASTGARGNIGIGFAIPADTAQLVYRQLIEGGKVNRGFLGVQVSSPNRELKPALRDKLGVPNGGALVEGVGPDTPAARAGLREGDVIVRFGDRQLRSFTDLEKAVLATPPGTNVTLEVVRDRKPIKLSLRTEARPEQGTE